MHKDFRTAWLLLLLRDGSSYGYELRRALAEREMRLDPAVMYRSLRDMERAGFISSRWVTSEAGPKRRVYDITAAGLDELARIAATIERSRDAQNEFLQAFEHGVQPPRSLA
ncbi:MAG TPA: PadR family transcriptional regulator [Solirubrobacteraceae bacterium]|nr:PadR family transcriptional regulator [Solirubrobacteraceae bacterium]